MPQPLLWADAVNQLRIFSKYKPSCSFLRQVDPHFRPTAYNIFRMLCNSDQTIPLVGYFNNLCRSGNQIMSCVDAIPDQETVMWLHIQCLIHNQASIQTDLFKQNYRPTTDRFRIKAANMPRFTVLPRCQRFGQWCLVWGAWPATHWRLVGTSIMN